MKIYEIGTGYTAIPAQMGAATEIVVEELANAFTKNGEDVEIIDIAAENRNKIDIPVSEVKVPRRLAATDTSLGIMHKIRRVVYSICLAGHIKKILRASSEKVVLHFHNQYNLFFVLKLVPKALLKKAALVYTVHSYIWGTNWEEIESTVKHKYFQEITCVKNADLVLVLNDITVDHFVNRLNIEKSKIKKTINGVNLERYRPLTAGEIAALKKENGLYGKKVIFQVGSVCERKNQLGSVKMLAEYLRAHRDTVYLYAGGIIDGEYQQFIADFAEGQDIAGQVNYVGELSPGEQLNAYYNMADCSVFTSALESFGLVIMEAVSCGTPVVLSQNLMFELKGGYSMYHTPEDFAAMVDSAMGKGKLSSDEIRDILDEYSWDSVARMHSTLFSAITDGDK